MKKGKLLLISSVFCLGMTLFATVSCNKKTETQNQNTILKVNIIDLSNNDKYKNKFAIENESLGVTKNEVIEIIEANKNNLFSNLIPNSNLSIVELIRFKDEGKIQVYVELDKYKNEQGTIVSKPKSFEVKLVGLKKDGLTTFIDYDDSYNKSIDLGKLNDEIKTKKASEWIKDDNNEQVKQVLLNAIKEKIRNIAFVKPITSINNENVLFGTFNSDDDKGLVYVEITFKNSIWWESGVEKEFKTTISFLGFKTISSNEEEKNTKVVVNDKILKKVEETENLYSYFDETFKDIEINEENPSLEQHKDKIKEFIKTKEMFLHNYEDTNIEIKSLDNSNNNENVKNGFFDFQIVFKNTNGSTSGTEKSFKLRFSGFKVKETISIESSKWIMKNNIISQENKDKFYYGIKVTLEGSFDKDKFIETKNISAILKYSENSIESRINLSSYIIEKSTDNKVTLFFTHNDWNDTNYPNGGKLFDRSEIIINIPGFNSIEGSVIGGIDEFEVQKISANSIVFNKKTYYYLSLDIYSPLGNLPSMSSDILTKDYVIKLKKNSGNEAEIDARVYISSWHMGRISNIFAFFDDSMNENKFEEYKKGTNISIKVPGFKIKNISFEENKNNQFKIKSAKWNKDNEKYFVEVELESDLSLPTKKEEYESILETTNERLILNPSDIEVKSDKNVIAKFTYPKWYLKEIGTNQQNLSLSYIIVKVAGFNYVEYMESIDSNNIKPL